MYPQQQYPQYPAAPVNTYPQQYQYPTAPPAPQYPTAPPAAPAAMPAAGSLDQFYNQPGGASGKAWSFHNKPIGTTYSGIVARPVTNADIQQQTDLNTGAPRFFRDGRPMFVMVVPMLVPQSQESPEGQAAWYVRGQARDELVRAMAEAGAPEGPPEAGAAISVTLVGQRPSGRGFNPTNIYRVVYQRPAGAAAVQATAPAETDGQAYAAVATPPAAPPAPPALGNLSPEQQALLAKLTGG